MADSCSITRKSFWIYMYISLLYTYSDASPCDHYDGIGLLRIHINDTKSDPCYVYFSEAKIYSDAADTCHGHNLHLVFYETAAEQEAVQDILNSHGLTNHYWVGAANFSGEWVWYYNASTDHVTINRSRIAHLTSVDNVATADPSKNDVITPTSANTLHRFMCETHSSSKTTVSTQSPELTETTTDSKHHFTSGDPWEITTNKADTAVHQANSTQSTSVRGIPKDQDIYLTHFHRKYGQIPYLFVMDTFNSTTPVFCSIQCVLNEACFMIELNRNNFSCVLFLRGLSEENQQIRNCDSVERACFMRIENITAWD